MRCNRCRYGQTFHNRGWGVSVPWSLHRQISVHWWRSGFQTSRPLSRAENSPSRRWRRLSWLTTHRLPSCQVPLNPAVAGVKTKYCHQSRSTKRWRYTTQETQRAYRRPLCIATIFWKWVRRLSCLHDLGGTLLLSTGSLATFLAVARTAIRISYLGIIMLPASRAPPGLAFHPLDFLLAVRYMVALGYDDPCQTYVYVQHMVSSYSTYSSALSNTQLTTGECL